MTKPLSKTKQTWILKKWLSGKENTVKELQKKYRVTKHQVNRVIDNYLQHKKNIEKL